MRNMSSYIDSGITPLFRALSVQLGKHQKARGGYGGRSSIGRSWPRGIEVPVCQLGYHMNRSMGQGTLYHGTIPVEGVF